MYDIAKGNFISNFLSLQKQFLSLFALLNNQPFFMQKVKLNVLGLSVSQTQTGAYALVLIEDNGDRRIPIIIGPVEAQSIAIQLEGLHPPRPLTHDLFKNIANAFQIEVLEVIIYKLEEGIFYSELVCEQGANRISIDSRTSDAVALALRFKCPIYTTEQILDKAGIVIEITDESREDSDEMLTPELSNDANDQYRGVSVEDLQQMLNEAIANENYEQASEIRDEISKRSKEE